MSSYKAPLGLTELLANPNLKWFRQKRKSLYSGECGGCCLQACLDMGAPAVAAALCPVVPSAGKQQEQHRRSPLPSLGLESV